MKIKYRDANFKLPDSFYVRQNWQNIYFYPQEKTKYMINIALVIS